MEASPSGYVYGNPDQARSLYGRCWVGGKVGSRWVWGAGKVIGRNLVGECGLTDGHLVLVGRSPHTSRFFPAYECVPSRMSSSWRVVTGART